MRNHVKDLKILAQADEIGASLGDLASIKRNMERDQLLREAEAMKVPTAAAPARRKSKGIAPRTLNSIRAIAAAIHLGKDARTAQGLAKNAYEIARQLNLPGAVDMASLDPAMREIASAFIDGINMADASDV